MKYLDKMKLATRLYQGQVDKAGRPLIEHSLRVWAYVADHKGDDDQQEAALYHDVLEVISGLDLQGLHDLGVAPGATRIIHVLHRREGQMYIEYIRACASDPKAKLIKEADLVDNMDPARHALLMPEVSASLMARYNRAWKIIKEGTIL